ncbi:hypothetical protein D3C75_897270 [compost metagenome]
MGTYTGFVLVSVIHVLLHITFLSTGVVHHTRFQVYITLGGTWKVTVAALFLILENGTLVTAIPAFT